MPLAEKESENIRAQVFKWGHSLTLRLPKPNADEAKLNVGDSLEIEVEAVGNVQLHRIGRVPTLAELVSLITPENRYGEVQAGEEIGREMVEW